MTRLERAEAIYQSPDCPRFDGTTAWLAAMLARARGASLPTKAHIHAPLLLAVKYGLATLAAALVLAWSLWLAPLAVLAFYAVEVQWLFLMPVALDGSARPFRDSRALMQRTVGTAAAVAGVLPIAARMLLGRWAVGCIAVLLWYEEARTVRP